MANTGSAASTPGWLRPRRGTDQAWSFAIVATLLNGTRVYLRLRRWSPVLEWSA